jgi:hypothetical protein
VRNIIGSPQYACLFDTQLAEDSQARGKWHTRDGGMYYAVGIGGSIMGHGGDVALIDDPVENLEAGQSELQRKRVGTGIPAHSTTGCSQTAPSSSSITVSQIRGRQPYLFVRKILYVILVN